MKKLIIIFVFCLAGILSAQSSRYDYIINRESVPGNLQDIVSELDALPENLDTTELRLRKIYLMLEKILIDADADTANELYSYMQQVRKEDPKLQNTLFDAFIGSTQALVGYARNNPIDKVKFLKEGVAMLDENIEKLKQENPDDKYALGFAYFLRSSILAKVPSFIALSKEAQDTLKTALQYMKESDLTKESGDLVAEIYKTYSEYYKSRGKIRSAKKSLETALKFAYSDQLKNTITQLLDN